MVGISGMGLGNGRQRAGAGLPEKVRLGNGSERAHSPNDAEGGRKRDVSYGSVDGISAAAARQGRFAGADEGTCGAVEERVGNYQRELRAGPSGFGSR